MAAFISETFQQFGALVINNPYGSHDILALQRVLVLMSRDLLDAIDTERIEFKKQEDKTMLLGLLAVSIEYGLNGHGESIKPFFEYVTDEE